jgi:hypothetical protein
VDRAAAAVVAVRDNSSASKVNTAIVITVTTGVADAISADAAGSVAAVVAVRDNSREVRAENKDSAHHSLQSFRMARQSAGSIRSAKAGSFANQATVIWPSLVMRTFRRR